MDDACSQDHASHTGHLHIERAETEQQVLTVWLMSSTGNPRLLCVMMVVRSVGTHNFAMQSGYLTR